MQAWGQHRAYHLSYSDLPGRAGRYLRKGRLPPLFASGLWPTHAQGVRWTRRALLDIFAQAMSPPSHVPDGWQCFHPTYLTSKCMVVRQVRIHKSRLGCCQKLRTAMSVMTQCWCHGEPMAPHVS